MVNSRQGSPDHGTDQEALTAEQLESLVQEAITEIEKDKFMDEQLWWSFKDHFEDFTEAHFSAVKRTTLSNLRQSLRMRGVWVETDYRKAKLPKALINLLEEEEMQQWTKKELQGLATSGHKEKTISELLIAQIKLAEENYVGFDIREQSIPAPASTSTPGSTSIPTAPMITPQVLNNPESYYASNSLNVPGNFPHGPEGNFQPTNPTALSEMRQLNNQESSGTFPQRARTNFPTSYQFKMPPPDPLEAQRPLRPPGYQNILVSPILPATKPQTTVNPQLQTLYPAIVPPSPIRGMTMTAGEKAAIVRKWGHPWFHFSPYETGQSMFTETELRRLHRRFGHPETDRLHKLLTKAGHDDVDRSILEQITKFCHQCQMHSAAPRRFKFTLRDDREFNFEILADVMYLDEKPVLHVIDVGTSFQGATFLREMSAKVTWEALRRIWIDTYLGPPDIITHDAGTNFASKEFRSEAKIMGITCKEVPVEAHWSIGKLERYHQPLRRAWEIISTELRGKCSPQAMLQMAVKAVNDTAGPDGLVPTLLVFGAYPRISYDSPPSASTAQRAATIEKTMKALRQKTAERTVRDALNTRNGPNVSHILDLPLGSLVRVYREKKGWTGPFKVLSIENHDVTVDTENGPSKVRTTAVQPYHDKDDEPNSDPELSDHDDLSEEEGDDADDVDDFIPERDPEPTNMPVKRGRGRPKGSKNKPKNVVNWQEAFVQFFPDPDCSEMMLSEKEYHNMELANKLRAEGKIDGQGKPFETSDQTEIQNLIDNGVFAFEKYDDKIHGNARLFRSRMVREIKYDANNKPYEKSRLVVQGYADEGKKEILTQSPTIQRASQRIILALAPSIRKLVESDIYLRDITQAYTQSKVPLIRKIYARLPKELDDKYPPDTIMLVIRPLYGLAEAGLLWFFTYHSHHLDALKMSISTFDPCLLITDPNRAEKNCFGIVGMQTDDTLFIGTPGFRDMENNALVYKAKDVSKLTTESPLNFNGCRTSTDGTTYSVKQKGQAKRLALIPTSEDNYKEIYVRQRARGAYIASICQPEASYDLSRAAQTTEPEAADCAELNKRLQWQIENLDRGLEYVEIDLKNAAIYVFVDGSFANNKDLSSQIGYVICLGNERRVNDSFTLKANIIHWSSTKCKRITRSVLASEIYGMVSGFDMAFCITQTVNQIINSLCSICNLDLQSIPLILCTDSYSLYESITKLGTTAEKRLMIDIMALRGSYETKEITEIRWINGNDNPADAMTKSNPNKTLEKMVSTNEVTIRVEGMVTRKVKGN